MLVMNSSYFSLFSTNFKMNVPLSSIDSDLICKLLLDMNAIIITCFEQKKHRNRDSIRISAEKSLLFEKKLKTNLRDGKILRCGFTKITAMMACQYNSMSLLKMIPTYRNIIGLKFALIQA